MPIRFTDVDGWTKEARLKTVNVQTNQTVSTNGVYQKITTTPSTTTTTGSLSVEWRDPRSDGMERTGTVVYIDGLVINPSGVKETRATFKDNSGHEYTYQQVAAPGVTREPIGIDFEPINQGFSDNSIITVTLSIVDGSGNLIENIATRNFIWCLQSPCNTSVTPPPVTPPVTTTNNSEPTFISGTVSSQEVAQKGSLQFRTVWKDAENNPIVGVKVRYRRDGGTLGDYPWREEILDYVLNTNPATFEKTVQIDETEGPYEFEFQASDVEQLEGSTLHTTAWQGLGQFSVIEVTNNQAPKLQATALSSVMPGQLFKIQLNATDPNLNLREIQIDWTGKGGSDGMVTAHAVANGEIIVPSHVYDLTLRTNLYWTATAYDTLGVKSNTVRQKLTIGRPSIQPGGGLTGGKSSGKNSCGNTGAKCLQHLGDPVIPALGSQAINLTLLKVDGLHRLLVLRMILRF
ncbi:MAG: hypothetical protein R3E08_09230 [Thiotrichaceae bacterium]